MIKPRKNNNGVYCLRKAIPVELRQHFNKTEIVRTLSTKNRDEADLAAPAVISEINNLIQQARRALKDSELWSTTLVKTTATYWFNDSLCKGNWESNVSTAEGALVADKSFLEQMLERDTEEAIYSIYLAIKADIEEALSLGNLSLQISAPYWSDFIVEMAKRKIELIDRSYYHLNFKRNLHELPALLSETPEYLTPSYQGKPNSINLSTLRERYTEVLQRRQPDAAKKRLATYNSGLNRAVSYFGTKDIKTICRRDLSAYHSILEQLPTQANLKKLPLNEQVKIADRDKLKRISQLTVRQNLIALSGLLAFAVSEGYIDTNYADGITKNIVRTNSTSGKDYTSEEIHKIFASPIYTDGVKPKVDFGEAYYWLPLLMYYTGARLNELAQLYVSQIHLAEDVPYIRISAEYSDQSVKTNDTREIPIHSDLLTRGFGDYISQLDDGRIFPQLTQSVQGNYGYNVSAWFGRYIKALGIDRKGLKPSHSFRHSFISQCRALGMREDIQNAITGHSNNTISSKYGSISLEVMSKQIERIKRLD